MTIVDNKWKECDHMSPGIVLTISGHSSMTPIWDPCTDEYKYRVQNPKGIRCSRCKMNMLEVGYYR